MSKQSLAVKYRPKTFDDVIEQDSIKTILNQQIRSDEVKNAYLFCGSAGCGKTTCARIFANAINKGLGNPIEIDAASNNSVDNIREISQQAKTKSLDSEYKIFILDEVHMLSNSAWNAMLKLIEEPPLKTIFIMCTTDPQKIPKTILSRCQRYDFKRISIKGIVGTLDFICRTEQRSESTKPKSIDRIGNYGISWNDDALEYIAKLADGCLRDAITMLDKCLSYSDTITLANVVEALGVADYEKMMDLTDAILNRDVTNVIECIDSVYRHGNDLKQFIKQYLEFSVDVCTELLTGNMSLTQLPETDDIKKWLLTLHANNTNIGNMTILISALINLKSDIKWDTNPRAEIIARLLEITA